MSDSGEVTDPESYLTPAEDGIDPDKVKITGEAVVRSFWQIVLALIFGGW